MNVQSAFLEACNFKVCVLIFQLIGHTVTIIFFIQILTSQFTNLQLWNTVKCNIFCQSLHFWFPALPCVELYSKWHENVVWPPLNAFLDLLFCNFCLHFVLLIIFSSKLLAASEKKNINLDVVTEPNLIFSVALVKAQHYQSITFYKLYINKSHR